jgi:predicted dehydrogenase
MKANPISVSRRQMIAGALTLPITAVRGTAANSVVTIGVLGSGGRGPFVASLMTRTDKARVTALCDVIDSQIEHAKKAIPVENPRIFKRTEDLLASDVDAVIISSPVYLHPEHFEAVVRSGKHIYIEKPAAVDAEGCRRIIHAAAKASPNVNISFGFQRRYGQVFLKAKRAVDAGEIGPIRQAHSHWLKGLPEVVDWTSLPPRDSELEKIRQWKWWRDTFGDSIVETFCHGIDVLNWFLGGHPQKALGSGGRTVIQFGDIRDHVNVSFEYPNAVQASLTGSFITPVFYRSVCEQFFGSKGAIETCQDYWTQYRDKGEPVTERSPRDISLDSAAAFLDRVLTGKVENTAVRGAESTLTAIMGRMAMDLAREVTWDEVMKS